MTPRPAHLQRVRRLLRQFPVVAVLGPRQVGKTTLAKQIAAAWKGDVHFYDLERPDHLAVLAEPLLALESLRGLVVLDEVQLRPDLFGVLRALADRDVGAKFLLSGSASPELLRQGSETLAGRIAFHELTGLGLEEVGVEAAERLWLRGGFPSSFLAESDDDSYEWRLQLVSTFLERDLPNLGVRVPAPTMRRFWSMVAHYHGQIWNGAELARALGVSQPTVRRYVDALQGALVVRSLQPWHENLSKRQVRSPKVYVADSGLLHALLGVSSRDALLGHPKVGASWEGFVIAEVIRQLGARPESCFFWATQAGAELDLLVVEGGKRLGVEVKRTVAPAVTPSMRIAMKDLRLDRLVVVHAGEEAFAMGEGVRAVSLGALDFR